MTEFTLQSVLGDYYDDFARGYEKLLKPVDLLEIMAVAQIVHNQMLIRRCMTAPDRESPDIQKLLATATRNYRMAMKDLRQFQADRVLRDRLDLPDLPGAVSVRDIQPFLKPEKQQKEQTKPARNLEAHINALLDGEAATIRTNFALAELTKRPQAPPKAA
jgi:hypothetical protein